MQRPIQVWGTHDEQDVQRIANHAPAQTCALEKVQDLAAQMVPDAAAPRGVALTNAHRQMEVARAALEDKVKALDAKGVGVAARRRNLGPLRAQLAATERIFFDELNQYVHAASAPMRRTIAARVMAVLASGGTWSVMADQGQRVWKMYGLVNAPMRDGVSVRLAVFAWLNDGIPDNIQIGPVPADLPQDLTDAHLVGMLDLRFLHQLVTLRRAEEYDAQEAEFGVDIQPSRFSVHDLDAMRAAIDFAAGWATALYDACIPQIRYAEALAKREAEVALGITPSPMSFKSRAPLSIIDGEG